MSVAEQAIFEIVVKGEQAKVELEKTSKATGSLAGGYGKLKLAVDGFNASQVKAYENTVKWGPTLTKLSDDIAKPTRGFTDLTGAAKRLQQQIGPQAAAISSIANALGDTNSATGKAIQITGQLAASWAAGGPLGLAVAGLSAGVIALQRSWEDELRAQDEALSKSFVSADKAIDERKGLEARRDQLRRELGGPETSAQVYARYQAQIDDAEKRLQAARDGRDRAGWANLTKTIELLREVQGLEAARAAGQGAKVNTGPRKAALSYGDESMFAASEAQGADYLSALRDSRRNAIHQEITDLAEASKQRATYAKMWADAELTIEQDKQASLNEVADIAMRQRLAKEEAFAAASADLAQQAIVAPIEIGTTQAFDTLQSYWDMKANGEKYAEEKASAAFMKGIGQQLVGIGIRSEFEGAAKLFNPATAPIGAAEMVFGGAAIAAGLSLGAGGSAIGARVAGKEKADKDAADALKKDERGVNGGRGSGSSRSSMGGGLTIVNNWGVAGPPAEDAARVIVDRIRLADRRRMR